MKLSRRTWLKGLSSLPALGTLASHAQTRSAVLGFKPIAPSDADVVRVPEGYVAQLLYGWGDATGIAPRPPENPRPAPLFKQDGSGSAADAALQAGMHHDGMHFFPIDGSSTHGLLAMNHEYTDEGLLHRAGAPYDREAVTKSQNSHGLSVIEVKLVDKAWQVVRPSRYARRITAATPMRVAGPLAGHDTMKTSEDPSGVRVLGTVNNCANGYTPWGTYLTCEENWYANFGTDEAAFKPTGMQARYSVKAKASYPWHKVEARFDVAREPNEVHRFGWVVEVDPFDANSTPVKRTALGRFIHEGAALSLMPDGALAYYMGDDAVFEYVYKFVARDKFDKANPASGRNLLDHGTLYAAKFSGDGWAGGAGEWLELTHGKHGLTAANGFASQAEVLLYARHAAEIAGATKMDRPEWCAVQPGTRDVCVALTNNSARGRDGFPRGEGPNAANPRNENLFGHVIRMRERNADVGATSFAWEFVALGGDPNLPNETRRSRFRPGQKGDAFGSPDGLHFDARGILWVQTDLSPRGLNQGDYAGLGNNQMLAVDPATGEFKRFLTAPRGAEVTGCNITPDGTTMFVNIQHPGEGQASNWPDGPGMKPRSATLAIRRVDGGLIGA